MNFLYLELQGIRTLNKLEHTEEETRRSNPGEKMWFKDCPEEAAPAANRNAMERKFGEAAQVRKMWFKDCPEEAAPAAN
jgi:hypothetical protein